MLLLDRLSLMMMFIAAGLIGGLANAQHHNPDPFAGSGCDCDSFCDNKCSINGTKAPINQTFYRMTPYGVFSMDNKDTGDTRGDTSFVISRRTTAYECRHQSSSSSSSFFCDGMTQFDGDDKNSTDLVMSFTIEVDGQWGPYLYCNPVNSSNQVKGPWSCTVELDHHSGPPAPPPPPQCTALNFSIYNGYCFQGFRPTSVTAESEAECCTAASEHKATKWNYFPSKKQCDLYEYAMHTQPCSDGVLGFFEPTSPKCNCSRVHKTVGRENLTMAMPGYTSMHPAGGEWYSHPVAGKCTGDQRVGDGSGCTWRVVAINKILNASCMYGNIDGNVEQHNEDCFSACSQPHNVTSDCYLRCYNEAVERMTGDELAVPWGLAFDSEDKSKGGCPTVHVDASAAFA